MFFDWWIERPEKKVPGSKLKLPSACSVKVPPFDPVATSVEEPFAAMTWALPPGSLSLASKFGSTFWIGADKLNVAESLLALSPDTKAPENEDVSPDESVAVAVNTVMFCGKTTFEKVKVVLPALLVVRGEDSSPVRYVCPSPEVVGIDGTAVRTARRRSGRWEAPGTDPLMVAVTLPLLLERRTWVIVGALRPLFARAGQVDAQTAVIVDRILFDLVEVAGCDVDAVGPVVGDEVAGDRRGVGTLEDDAGPGVAEHGHAVAEGAPMSLSRIALPDSPETRMPATELPEMTLPAPMPPMVLLPAELPPPPELPVRRAA